MTYRPYPIFDPQSGLRLKEEPWRLPHDATQILEGGFVRRGRWQKRGGHAFQGALEIRIEDEIIDTGDGTDTYSGTLTLAFPASTHTPYPIFVVNVLGSLLPLRVRLTLRTEDAGSNPLEGTVELDGTLTGDLSVALFNAVTDAYTMTWTTPPGAGKDITLSYSYLVDQPVMGIFAHSPRSGTPKTLALSTRRAWEFVDAGELWSDTDPGGPDLWSGADSDYFSATMLFGSGASGADELLVSNGVDPPNAYDGASWNVPSLEYDAGGPYDVLAARIVVQFQGRLILFDTTEETAAGTLRFPQRGRWSPINAPYDLGAADASAIDAPTADTVQSAHLLSRNVLVVAFSSSTWLFRPTGDPLVPFEWLPLTSETGDLGVFGLNSLVRADRVLIGSGSDGLITIDGQRVTRLGDADPDNFERFEPLGQVYTQGIHIRRDRQAWQLYTPVGATHPETVVGLSFENGQLFELPDMPFHVAGEKLITSGSDTWDDGSPLSWDAGPDVPWNSVARRPGFPELLLGDRGGLLHRYPEGGADVAIDGSASPIPFRFRTKRLNPFLDQGVPRAVRLGLLELIVTRQTGAEITVRVVLDFDQSPIFERTISIDDPASLADKVWRQVPVDLVANFVSIEIESLSTRPVEVYGVVPHFGDGGRLEAF